MKTQKNLFASSLSVRVFRVALVASVLIVTTASVLAAQVKSNEPIATQQSESDAGTICVFPNSSKRPTRFSPGGEYNPATLLLVIDDQEPLFWPHFPPYEPVRITGIRLDGRHLLVLKSDGKPIQSLWFRFSQYRERKLCLAFDGYQGVQLADKHSALWCKCKER